MTAGNSGPAPVRAEASTCRGGQQQKPAALCLEGDAGIPAITGGQVHENRISRGMMPGPAEPAPARAGASIQPGALIAAAACMVRCDWRAR
jgi:hypothetical protein